MSADTIFIVRAAAYFREESDCGAWKNISDFIFSDTFMEKHFMLHVVCHHGHVLDENKEECRAGHVSLFKSVKCPIASCGFLSEPRYAHEDIPLDDSYHEVKKHFKSMHGYELEFSNDDVGDVVKEVGGGRAADAVVKDDPSFVKKDENPKESNEPKEKDPSSEKKAVGNVVEAVTIGATEAVSKDESSVVNIDGDPKESNEPKEKVASSELEELNDDHKEAENNLSCPKCFKIMRTKFTLRRHISQVHANQEKFKCTYCVRSFCAKISLTYHLKSIHPALGQSFDCEKCGEVFADFQAYRAHRAEHRVNQEKDILKCRYCNVEIKRTSMNRHITEVHNIEIRYDGKKTVSMAYPHKCIKCDYGFKRKFDLKRHQQAKHENRVFVCDVCSKRFKYPTNLKRHVKTVHDDAGYGNDAGQGAGRGAGHDNDAGQGAGRGAVHDDDAGQGAGGGAGRDNDAGQGAARCAGHAAVQDSQDPG